MEKTLNVEGMMCPKCVARVEKALQGTEGVQSVDVSLEAKTAKVVLSGDVADAVLESVVTEAGYPAHMA